MAVTVKSPTTRYELTMAKLESWIAGGAKSPNEQVLKNKLRSLWDRAAE
jgi:hypothetical protein